MYKTINIEVKHLRPKSQFNKDNFIKKLKGYFEQLNIHRPGILFIELPYESYVKNIQLYVNASKNIFSESKISHKHIGAIYFLTRNYHEINNQLVLYIEFEKQLNTNLKNSWLELISEFDCKIVKSNLERENSIFRTRSIKFNSFK